MIVPGILARLDLLVPLLTAHLLADFVFQTDRMAAGKGRWPVLVGHVAVVAIASGILIGHWGALDLVLLVSLLHLLIDAAKVALERLTLPKRPEDAFEPTSGFWSRNGRPTLFLGDQALHVVSLLVAVQVVAAVPFLSVPPPDAGLWATAFGPSYLHLLVLLSGWILATTGSGYFFALFLARFETQLEPDQRGGLSKGGYWIGVTERSLIYLFILVGEPTGIGFLVAAKSVFRIGELRESKDRKLAEYILIGTLLSFAAAMVVGLATRAALGVVR